MADFIHIIAKYTIPIRARAYNDCAKERVLPKTRSRGGIPGPKMGPFWVLEMVHTDDGTRHTGISFYSAYV